MDNILMEKTAGLPNIVWAGVAVAGYFILSRALGSTPAASGTTDTGSGGTPGSGGPPGVGPCPIITPVQCGSGFTSQAGIDANGCPDLQCVPIGTGGGSTSTCFITVGLTPGYPSNVTVAQVASISGLGQQLCALNGWLKCGLSGAYDWNLPGNVAGQEFKLC